jgi:hypothetical protein
MHDKHDVSNVSMRMIGVALGVLLGGSGCATEAGNNAFSQALTPVQYAQISDDQCNGVPANERELGVFAYREAIANAQPLKEEYSVGKTKLTRDRGVQIAIRAQPAMTAPWLERVATCHVALVRSGQLAAAAGDPQLVPGATVHVEAAYTGYIVSVRVPDDASAAEVMRRATVALTGPTGPATAERLSK